MASSVVTPTPDMAPVAAAPVSKPAGYRAPWWLQPVLVVVVLPGFGLYATWAALQGRSYQVGPYLSPFYSPEIWTTGPISSAIWILWIPLLFRATCYYYRKSYYRAFFWDPPACAINESRRGRLRRRDGVPLRAQQPASLLPLPVHPRLVFLWYDAFECLHVQGPPLLGPGLGDPAGQRDLALPVLAVLPFAAPPARRQRRLLLLRGGRQRSPWALEPIEPC